MNYLSTISTNLVQRCFLLAISFLFFSCSKEDESLKRADAFSYEVDCSNCEISYIDQSNATKKLFHQQGKWNYAFDADINFELKLSVITTSSSQQTIHAYVLKNNEVVFGDRGYNSASISYDTKKATGKATYGTQQNSNNTGNNSNGNNGGSTAPTSSVCGAKNKTGGYCKRKVSGGGYCWQHR